MTILPEIIIVIISIASPSQYDASIADSDTRYSCVSVGHNGERSLNNVFDGRKKKVMIIYYYYYCCY